MIFVCWIVTFFGISLYKKLQTIQAAKVIPPTACLIAFRDFWLLRLPHNHMTKLYYKYCGKKRTSEEYFCLLAKIKQLIY